jgi:hypothetical protein
MPIEKAIENVMPTEKAIENVMLTEEAVPIPINLCDS